MSDLTFVSLNSHPTNILRSDTPVIEHNKEGRTSFVFDAEKGRIEDWVLASLPPTTLPVPKVGATDPQTLTWLVDGVEIPVHVSAGSHISNLPEPKEGVIYVTSYPTAKAGAELGRKDLVNSGPTVYASYDEETGRGSTILGCLGINTFAS